MAFHRLVAPTYFGGLPAGYDYINNPALNGDVGVPAGVDGKKATGPNEGSYFATTTEPANSTNQNRPNSALAENCDELDDILRTSRPLPAFAAYTAGAAESQRQLAGLDVFVGRSGVTVTQEERERLIQVVNATTLAPILDASGVPITVNDIRDSGDAANVIGTEASGFHTGAIAVFSANIPNTTNYRLLYLARGTVADESDPADATGDMGYVTQLILEAVKQPFVPANSSWADVSQLASTSVQEAIDEVVDALAATTGSSGSNKVGVSAITSAITGGLTTVATTVQAWQQAVADQMPSLGSSPTWTGSHTFSGTTPVTFSTATDHITGPAGSALILRAGHTDGVQSWGPGGQEELRVGDDFVGFGPNGANLSVTPDFMNLTPGGGNNPFSIRHIQNTGTGTEVAGDFQVQPQQGRNVGAGDNNDGGYFLIVPQGPGTGGNVGTGKIGGWGVDTPDILDHDGDDLGPCGERSFVLSNQVDDGETIADWYTSPFGILLARQQETVEITIIANDRPENGSSPSVAKYVTAWNRDAATGMFSGSVQQVWTHNDNGEQPQTLTASGTATLPRIDIARTSTTGNIQITAFIRVMRATVAD